MSFGHISDEERKKRREQFGSDQAKLGLGPTAAGRSSFLDAGKLGQQAQLGLGPTAATPAQAQMQASAQAAPKAPVVQPAQVSPQIATNIASKQREQNMAQQQQAQLQQRATRDTDALAARQNAQKIISLPAAQQPKAVTAMQTAVRPSVQPQPTPNIKPNINTAVKPVMGMVPPPNSIARPAVANAVAKSVADTVTPSQSLFEDDASVTNPVYAEGVTRGNPDNKKFGVSVDNNAAVAQPIAPTMGGGNSGFGFGVMAAPRKAYGEDSRRAVLAMDIKPHKNGAGLTTGQIALKNSILNGDDAKYANEQYTTQMNAAQKLAQEGMKQSGENSRAELDESGANSRASQQLGFDTAKFQQTAEQAQQENSFNSRRLDMQQANNDVANHMPKQLNALYDKYAAAKTDDQKSAVAAQIQILKGSDANSDKEYWTSIGGGETLSADELTSVKNPDVLLNRNTGETRSIPLEPIDYANDPRALAIKNNTSLSNEERRKQLEALR